MKTVILVHGGAGAWDKSAGRLKQAISVCAAATAAGQAVLTAGGSALDAVETAVRLLEDAPTLDAGRGSYPNAIGEVEMDALMMDGRTLNLGAIAAVQRIQHPISLARYVLEHNEHNFFVGPGAEALADQAGIPRCETADLLTEENRADFRAQDGRDDKPSETAGPLGDTVGAVALDADGNLAAATSTGGTRYKQPGRVGDSPLVGSGGYADNWTAAVSATGHGEALMRIVISKQVCDFVGSGLSAQAACEAAIKLLAERTNGRGGLIAIDARGQVGMARNTNGMPYAYAISREPVVSGH